MDIFSFNYMHIICSSSDFNYLLLLILTRLCDVDAQGKLEAKTQSRKPEKDTFKKYLKIQVLFDKCVYNFSMRF